MTSEGRGPSLTIKSIHRYLPTVYTDQMIVDFECGCWRGSRSASFGYDCPTHKAGRTLSPLDVLHSHDCPYYPPGVCPDKVEAQRVLDALAAAGYRVAKPTKAQVYAEKQAERRAACPHERTHWENRGLGGKRYCSSCLASLPDEWPVTAPAREQS